MQEARKQRLYEIILAAGHPQSCPHMQPFDFCFVLRRCKKEWACFDSGPDHVIATVQCSLQAQRKGHEGRNFLRAVQMQKGWACFDSGPDHVIATVQCSLQVQRQGHKFRNLVHTSSTARADGGALPACVRLPQQQGLISALL